MKRWITSALALTAFAAAGPAIAADLPAPAPPPPRAPATYVPAAPAFTWTGFYIGVNGGYGFGSSTWNAPASTGAFNTDGFLVGGTIGANWQLNALVLGVEGDFDYSTINGSSGVVCNAPTAASCETATNWLATVRGRVGYAFDHILVYGTGGGAFANLQTGLNPPQTFGERTAFGWTAGAGVEVAFTQNWTAKLEYLYVDLENQTCALTVNCGLAAGSTVTFTESLVRAGLNYKF